MKKEKGSDIPKYTVFFKGRDTDVIAAAFREFADRNEKKKSKTPFRERLLHFKGKAASQAQSPDREREKEKSRDREPGL